MDKKRLILGIIVVIVEIILMALIIRHFVVKEKFDEMANNFSSEYDDPMWTDEIPVSPSGNKIAKVEENVVKITINNEIYTIRVDNSILMDEILNVLPESFNMNELNGNEKYYYLSESMKNIDTQLVNQIEKGDVMLFGSNCLVIFYDSFESGYRYTKIGHIDNLGDIGNSDVEVSITK